MTPNTSERAAVMMKTVLWIDDSPQERAAGEALLRKVGGITPRVAASSDEAKRVIEHVRVKRSSQILCVAGRTGPYTMMTAIASSRTTSTLNFQRCRFCFIPRTCLRRSIRTNTPSTSPNGNLQPRRRSNLSAGSWRSYSYTRHVQI